MAYKIIPSKQVIKYLKKLKDTRLKQKFVNVMYDDIATNPYNGQQKSGDLAGVWSVDFNYAGTTYRVAYEIQNDSIVPVLLCGTHENFYEQLKNIR